MLHEKRLAYLSRPINEQAFFLVILLPVDKILIEFALQHRSLLEIIRYVSGMMHHF